MGQPQSRTQTVGGSVMKSGDEFGSGQLTFVRQNDELLHWLLPA
jgi:hypothetical protein